MNPSTIPIIHAHADGPIAIKCAWCQGHMGGNPHALRVSHGICQACMDKIKAEQSQQPEQKEPHERTNT